MSHFARPVAVVLVLVACSSSKAPEAHGAEAPVSTEATPPEPALPEPALPEPAVAPADPAQPAPATGEPEAPSAAPEAPSVATLFVRETPAACQAEGVRQCLAIRGSESEQWRNFFGSIEGFSYEPGYAYQLRVEVSNIPNPPADAASIHYRLLELVSKKKVK